MNRSPGTEYSITVWRLRYSMFQGTKGGTVWGRQSSSHLSNCSGTQIQIFPFPFPFQHLPPSSTKVHLENLKLPPRLCNQWHLKHGHTSTPHLFTAQHIDGLSTSELSLRGTHKPCVTDRGGLGGAAGTSLRGSPLAKSPAWPRGPRFGRVWGVIVKEVISSSWQNPLLCKCSSLHPSQFTQI